MRVFAVEIVISEPVMAESHGEAMAWAKDNLQEILDYRTSPANRIEAWEITRIPGGQGGWGDMIPYNSVTDATLSELLRADS